MRRIHKKNSPQYRPLVGYPYKTVFIKMAQELTKTSLNDFDDLATLRHAGYELWKRIFLDTPFPPDADILRTQYHKDPNIVYNPLKP